jgi:hypothetical protein
VLASGRGDVFLRSTRARRSVPEFCLHKLATGAIETASIGHSGSVLTT